MDNLEPSRNPYGVDIFYHKIIAVYIGSDARINMKGDILWHVMLNYENEWRKMWKELPSWISVCVQDIN